jgi:hypothetical protein
MVVPSIISTAWQPTKIRRVERVYPTGSEVVAVATDTGAGFAKFIGNKEGPHVLACEYMGTKLAALLGLQVFEHAILDYDGVPEIRFPSGGIATRGATWVARKEEGGTWSGAGEDLCRLSNAHDLGMLVVLDCWIRNWDRHYPACPPDEPLHVNHNNVFFSRENTAAGTFRLIAMDHTHAFTRGRPLTTALAHIERIQDETLYGMFPVFRNILQYKDMVAACARLSAAPDAAIQEIVDTVPAQWELQLPVREAIYAFLCRRRDYVASALDLPARVFPQREFPDLL